MRKIFALLFWTVISTPLISVAADVDIKGIHLGMTPSDVEALGGQRETVDGDIYNIPDFTIGGAGGKLDTGRHLNLIFDDGLLADFYLLFYPENFESVVAAVRSKYPALKCINSTVQNRSGAKYTQTECRVRDARGLLEITRYVDLETSYFGMKSYQRIKAAAEDAKRRVKDI